VLVDGGAIVADGPPSVVLSPERLAAVFGVDPSMAGLAG
jgi:ABC-type cobalamin/Fe3+-siderophores transport system ATPase subunit